MILYVKNIYQISFQYLGLLEVSKKELLVNLSKKIIIFLFSLAIKLTLYYNKYI